MTENQAIKILKEEKSWESDDRKIDAFILAIQALEEIQQYRAIGTVRQVQDFITDWRKFRELGNLEELKALKKEVELYRNLDKTNFSDGYNKAIDEFVEAIRGIHYNYPIGTDADTNEPLYAHEDGTWHNLLNDVAEQMKGGAV